MTGIVNSTGAKSGIIGTITAAPVTGIDYEEGTYTPTVHGGSSDPSVGYSSRVGQYVKIGNLYLVMARIILSSTSGGSGRLEVLIPSVPLNVGADFNGSTRSVAFDANKNPNYVSPTRNANRVMFGYLNAADARDAAWANVDADNLVATSDIQFTVTYHAQ